LFCFLTFVLCQQLNNLFYKKFDLRLTRRAKAYSWYVTWYVWYVSSSCSQTVSLSPAVFTKDWPTTVKERLLRLPLLMLSCAGFLEPRKSRLRPSFNAENFIRSLCLSQLVSAQFVFTCESSYCFQCVLAIAVLSVRPSVSQKRSKLGSPNLHHRLPGRLVSGTVKLFHKFEGGHLKRGPGGSDGAVLIIHIQSIFGTTNQLFMNAIFSLLFGPNSDLWKYLTVTYNE